MDAVQGPKIPSHIICPSVGNAIEIIRSIVVAWSQTNGLTCLFYIIESGGRVETFRSGSVPSSRGSSENKLVVNCGDLTATIFWIPLEDNPTVSRDDEFIFGDVEDDDRSRTDLGRCRMRKCSNNE